MKYGFCFICLKRQNTAKFYRSQIKCYVCNRKHLKNMSSESKRDNQFENKEHVFKESEITNGKMIKNKTHM